MIAVTMHLAEWVLQPMLPPMQVAAIAMVLAALSIAAYVRTASQRPIAAAMLGLMRLVIVVALAGLLLGPSAVGEPTEETRRATLGILIDTSASMQREDAPTDAARFDHLTRHWLSEEQLTALQAEWDVRLLGLDSEARSISADQLRQSAREAATGDVTRYAEGLAAALLDLDRATGPGDGELVVLGDGRDSETGSFRAAASFAREREIPVHAVAVGREEAPPNVAVVALPRQDYLMLEEQGQLIVQVHQGGLDDGAVTVNITPEQGEPEQHEVAFNGRSSVTLDVPIEHDEPGLFAYDVSVEPLDGEVTTDDNQQRAFVEVIESGMRVLVLEGEPYWDTKFLAQALRRDQRLELTQITQVSQDRREQIVTRRTSAAAGDDVEAAVDAEAEDLPQTVDDFAHYDVVILGRRIEGVLDPSSLDALHEWVLDEGGQLVLARGRPYGNDSNAGRSAGERLGELEPVTWHGDLVRNVAISLTPAGRSSPLFSMAGLATNLEDALATLPPMRVVYAVDEVKPTARVLARLGRSERVGESEQAAERRAPAMVEMNVGSGRVLAVLGEGLWQWRLLSPEMAEYAGIFEAFWSNTVRYLVAGGDFQPGENVSLELGRSIVQAGDPLTIDVALRHAPPADFRPVVTLTAPDGSTRTVEPTLRTGARNRYRATVHPEQPGVWRASLQADPLEPAEQEKPFSAYHLDFEQLHSAANPAALRDLAEQTGGLFLDAAEPDDLNNRLQRRRVAQQVPPTPSYIWDSGWILLLLVTWLGLEWLGRRRAGWL